MKKITLLLFLFIGLTSNAQELIIETGKTYSSFKFKDHNGTSLENLHSTSNNYLALGFKRQVFTENLDLRLSLTYNSYGAIGSNNELGNYFEWDTDYLGLNIGFDYDLFTIKEIAFYLKLATSIEFIIRGNETINNQVFNIVGVEEFSSPAVFFKGGTGLKYPLTRMSQIYVQYQYGKSLGLNNESTNAELKIKSHMIGLGLLINLKIQLKLSKYSYQN